MGGLKLMARSTEVTVATELARELIERTKAGEAAVPATAQYFDGSLPTGQDAGLFPPSPYPKVTVDGREYTLFVDVTSVGTNLMSINVEVRWGDRSKTSIETYMRP